MQIDTKSYLYTKLAQHLAGEIKQGAFPKGKLPTEQVLKETHQVSIVTVRKALALLEREGLVERRHGSGTFIYGWKKPKTGSRFKKTNLVDYIPCAGSEYLPGSFFNFLMQAVQTETSKQDYNCVISPPDLYRAPTPVIKKRVDGVLVAGNFYPHDTAQDIPDYWQGVPDSVHKDNDHYLHQLVCSGLPVVAVANYSKHPDVHSVRADFDKAFAQVLQQLKELGHRHVLYTGGDEQWPEFANRVHAFQRQCKALCMQASLATYPSHGDYDHDLAVAKICHALQVEDRPSALIVGTGTFKKVTEAMEKLQLTIPSDLSVLMVSEAPIGADWGQAWRQYAGIEDDIASIELPAPHFAELAVQRLMALIDGHSFSEEQRVIKIPLRIQLSNSIAAPG